MKQGDFSSLAKDYINRAGYSQTALDVIARWAGIQKSTSTIADVGAGTGKLTQHLLPYTSKIIAVEPNDAMRTEGAKEVADPKVEWRSGSGEETGLPNSCADWLLMGSSFHWVDLKRGLTEFHRVLKPGGIFTALWNPRDIARSELHSRIEGRIKEIAPEIERVSSGGRQYTEGLLVSLVSTGHFSDPFLIEAPHEVRMSPERYLGAWRSVNDIQAQAGPERFEKIMTAISNEIAGMQEVVVPYMTRAWTVRRV